MSHCRLSSRISANALLRSAIRDPGSRSQSREAPLPYTSANADKGVRNPKKRSLSATSASPRRALLHAPQAPQKVRNSDRSLRDLLQLAIDQQAPEEALTQLYRKHGGIHMAALVTLFSRANSQERKSAKFDLTFAALGDFFPRFGTLPPAARGSVSVQQSGKNTYSATKRDNRGREKDPESQEGKARALYKELVPIQRDANFKQNIKPFWYYCQNRAGTAQQLVTTGAPYRQSLIHQIDTLSKLEADQWTRHDLNKPAIGPVTYAKMLEEYKASGDKQERLRRILGPVSHDNLAHCPAVASYKKDEAPKSSGVTMHSLRFIHLCDALAPGQLKSYI